MEMKHFAERTKGFRNKSIQFKLLTSMGTITVIAFVILALVVNHRVAKLVKEKIEADAEGIALSEAQKISKLFENSMFTLRSLAIQTQDNMNDPAPIRRQKLIRQLKTSANSNKTILSAWAMFEPNGYDGMDSKYGKTANSDANGVFIPIITANDSLINTKAVLDYQRQSKSACYSVPKLTGSEMILDPYFDINNYKGISKKLVTSLVCPVLKDKRFAGVVGVDILVDSLEMFIRQIKLEKGHKLMLLDGNLKVIAHSQSNMQGKQAIRLTKEVEQELRDEKYETNIPTCSYSGKNLIDQELDFNVITPIKISSCPQKWAFVVSIPQTYIDSKIANIRNIILFTGLFSLLLMLAVVYFSSRFIQNAIHSLIEKTKQVTENVTNGNLNTRIGETNMEQDFRPVADAIDIMLESLSKPLLITSAAMKKMANGDIPDSIQEVYHGDFEEIKNNLNTLIETTRAQAKIAQSVADGNLALSFSIKSENDLLTISLQNLVDVFKNLLVEIGRVSKAAKNGVLTERANVDLFKGSHAIIVKAINSLIDSMVQPITEERRVLVQITEGNIEELISQSYQGDHEIMKEAVNNVALVTKALHVELNNFSHQIKNGNLSYRGNPSSFKGAFADLVTGMNDLVDAIANPLNKAANYIERIAQGDIPDRIEDEYHGDFKTLKNNLNTNIDNLNLLISEMDAMHKQQKAGDYEVYIPTDKFSNAYKQMALGYNEAVKMHVDNILKIIFTINCYSKGDFTAEMDQLPGKQIIVNEYLNKLRSNLVMVGADLTFLISSASEGALSARADASKYKGAFKDIIEGFNQTLDQITGPINVVSDYMIRLSIGDISANLNEDFKGDFAKLQKALNMLIDGTSTLSQQVKLIAEGDLTINLEKRSENDHLVISLQQMLSTFKMIVGEFKQLSGNISTASEQLRATSIVISQGANEQAASTEEVSASLEEMSSSIQQNSDNSSETEKIAVKAADDIEVGNRSVIETINAMKDIATKISIIGVIADKTDMLALNAAIEAARAGMQGKGFAVVAQEVRRLAEHSQNAAKEIDTLVKSSLKIADETGQLLTKIVPDIKKTTRLVQEITATSHEQNSGAMQVNNAVQQLSQITQQNASVAEEMSASAEELAKQSQHLSKLVDYFKVETDDSSKINQLAQLIAQQKSSTKTKEDSETGKSKGIKYKMDDDGFERF